MTGALQSEWSELSIAQQGEVLGLRLREARISRGLSVRAFAKEIGVSASFVSQVENAKARPSVATLYSICSTLGISLDTLFSSENLEGVTTSAAESTPAAAVARIKRSPSNSTGHDDEEPRLEFLDLSPTVTHPKARRTLQLNSGVLWEQMAAVENHNIDFLLVRYEPGSSSTPDGHLMRHNGIEFGYLLKGELQIDLAFKTHDLQAGDSIAFESSTPHRLINKGTEVAEAVWLVVGRSGDTRQS